MGLVVEEQTVQSHTYEAGMLLCVLILPHLINDTLLSYTQIGTAYD